jgi:hypothetical protein
MRQADMTLCWPGPESTFAELPILTECNGADLYQGSHETGKIKISQRLRHRRRQ